MYLHIDIRIQQSSWFIRSESRVVVILHSADEEDTKPGQQAANHRPSSECPLLGLHCTGTPDQCKRHSRDSPKTKGKDIYHRIHGSALISSPYSIYLEPWALATSTLWYDIFHVCPLFSPHLWFSSNLKLLMEVFKPSNLAVGSSASHFSSYLIILFTKSP